MATPFEHFQQVQGAPADEGKRNDTPRNDFCVGDQKSNIGTDHSCGDPDEFPKITHLTHLELNDKPYFPVEGHVKSKEEESGENLEGDKVSSLIVMGCVKCFIYVMALKFDPECPNCKNTDLLDVVGNLPGKN